jgi:hypothetical protein
MPKSASLMSPQGSTSMFAPFISLKKIKKKKMNKTGKRKFSLNEKAKHAISLAK